MSAIACTSAAAEKKACSARVYDAVVIGGSFAGLAAALQLVRARRHVLIVDSGRARNRVAAHSHGVLAMDGMPGSTILATARAQVAAYPTVAFLSGEVSSARAAVVDAPSLPLGSEPRINITVDGVEYVARRALVATGVTDVLPGEEVIPGLASRWGKCVVACPYCHGYEIGGGSIGVLAAGPHAIHHATLIADWGDVTLFTDGKVTVDDAARERLTRRRVKIESTAVRAVEGPTAEEISGVRLADDRLVPVKFLFYGAAMQLNAAGVLGQLGVTVEGGMQGPMIKTDFMKATTVAGVYAAGDAARQPSNVSLATADGVMAGIGLHASLVAAEAGMPPPSAAASASASAPAAASAPAPAPAAVAATGSAPAKTA